MYVQPAAACRLRATLPVRSAPSSGIRSKACKTFLCTSLSSLVPGPVCLQGKHVVRCATQNKNGPMLSDEVDVVEIL